MKRAGVLFFLMFLICFHDSHASSTMPEFFQDIYTRYEQDYARTKNRDYVRFCRKFGLNRDNPENRRVFYQINFVHDLFTGSYCINFATGGVLGLPYVWHWTSPNPRHSITWTPNSIPLSKIKPPADFARYKTFADIDRVPSLYIGDLFSGKPKYFHPKTGEFYSFGWCSEREMAYSALMTLFGYECKVRQEGIHTWSEIWCECAGPGGSKAIICAYVDNSVDIVKWSKPKQTLDKWRRDIGSGTTLKWYNDTFCSASQKKKLREMTLTRDQTRWIEKRVAKWLGVSRKTDL